MLNDNRLLDIVSTKTTGLSIFYSFNRLMVNQTIYRPNI